jgi:uncharacterized membrane protein (UPF0127 family)
MQHHRLSSVIALFSSLLLLTTVVQALACPVENRLTSITINGHKLSTEIATGLDGHMCGLAFRHKLPADRGMLFAYARDQILGFWMKDTYLPLSIAFIDGDGTILEIHDMAPLDTGPRYISKSPARYALEVNQGWFADHDITVGDRVELKSALLPSLFRY